MSDKKQSSIEWLKDQLEQFGNKHELTVSWDTIDDLIEQAKAMHKEEIINSWDNGAIDATYGNKFSSPEQYYNETFGGNNGRKR